MCARHQRRPPIDEIADCRCGMESLQPCAHGDVVRAQFFRRGGGQTARYQRDLEQDLFKLSAFPATNRKSAAQFATGEPPCGLVGCGVSNLHPVALGFFSQGYLPDGVEPSPTQLDRATSFLELTIECTAADPVARLQLDHGSATLPEVSRGYQPRETRADHNDVRRFIHYRLPSRPRSALEGHATDEDHVVVRGALVGAYDSPRLGTEAFQLVMGHGAEVRVREQLTQG